MVKMTPTAPRRQPYVNCLAPLNLNYFRLYFHYMYFNIAHFCICRWITFPVLFLLFPIHCCEFTITLGL